MIEVTASEVARRLAANAEKIAEHLLPNGVRQGPEWCVGSVGGEEGQSLKVRIRGTDVGRWADFADKDRYHGDLLDLWAAVRGVSLGEAYKQACAHLGIERPSFAGHEKRSYRRPPKPQVSRPRDVELDYLTGERKLSTEAVTAYRLGAGNGEICFPYLRDGALIAAKYLRLERRDGKKIMRMEKDCEPCLFGWQAIPQDAREVTICEGEIDAISLWQMGKPALSVPNGATGHSWIEHEYENLERFDRIYLCFDNDEPGQKGAREIADRLGLYRCRLIEISKPFKDANDLLRAGINAIQLQLLYDKARTIDPVELRSAASFVDEVIAEFNDGDSRGYLTPWDKLKGKFRFRPGELTVFAGARGHGKSEAAGQITLDVSNQGGRCCVASMEFKPAKWIRRMTRQCAGVQYPSEEYIREIHRWYADKIWAFVATGTTKAERLLEVFDYARRRYQCDFFVVDNLAKCGIADDDYRGQKEFVDKLSDFARDNDVHVLLVHHVKKGDYDDVPGDDMDMRGSGAIGDMADSLIIWWRNRRKERERYDAEKIGAEFDEGQDCDALFKCRKQRNGEGDPQARLWFHPPSHQYTDNVAGRPKRYVKWTAVESGVA